MVEAVGAGVDESAVGSWVMGLVGGKCLGIFLSVWFLVKIGASPLPIGSASTGSQQAWIVGTSKDPSFLERSY